MGSRSRSAALFAAVAASAALSNFQARAGEQPMPDKVEEPQPGSSPWGLPTVAGLEYRFHLDATWGNFGFLNSLYTNPKPDQPSGNLGDHWFEGALKAGLSASYSGRAGQIYGKITGAGERTFGAPPSAVGEAASSFKLDDLYVGWRSGKLLGGLDENAVDFRVGRAPFALGHGFLIGDGGAEGGSRGGYWSNIRRAFAFASIGRFKTGAHTLEAFYLVRDELPEASTGSRLMGFNYELSLGAATTLGASYLRAWAHGDQKPTRNGLNVYDLRAFTTPFSGLPGLSFEAEYAREHNSNVLDSTAWTIQGSYEFGVAWKPRLSYRFAFFQGDDPGSERSEAFDPLFLGFYDWGSWFQGEIAGEYFVSNSNLISHQVRLHLAPSEKIGTGLIFYRFLLDQPASLASGVTSNSLASELDWYMDWKLNPHFGFNFVLAWADPGKAIAQAYGRTKDFWYGMIFAAYNY
jgi:Alginate export